ncbi:MAG: hypothetical protein KJO07_01410 [Deltaproteobacteria bacterium]|nr:hypothetical protein [Deltaproteobacteria bacterium]
MARCTQVGVIEERIESPTPEPKLGDQLRQAVHERASRLGATDVVYQKRESDESYAYARAEAYRCER